MAEKPEELNFERAEFDTDAQASPNPEAGGDSAEVSPSCTLCQVRIVDRYYRANERTLCPRCKEALEQNQDRGAPGAAGRALLFGAGGGALGALLYYGVAALTGLELGIIAIVVGIFVGKGVRRGAGLHRHWLYPALGLGLTYLAIVSTYVPGVMRALSEGDAAQSVSVAQALVVACALPFVMLFEFEIWGPVILAIGLWEGYRYARAPQLEYSGPFRAGRAPETSA